MINLNTNLSSLITQNSLKQSTNRLNQAIERMTTGFKINHAKDNAANYDIVTKMNSKVGSLEVAEDNTETAIDVITTASDSLSLIEDRLQRLRALQEQANNGTYGAESLQALNLECNSLVDEINRLYLTTEYNGVNLFLETTKDETGNEQILQETIADESTKLSALNIGVSSFSVYDSADNLVQSYDTEAEDTIGDIFEVLSTHGFSSKIENGEITIASDNGSYVMGDLADSLGLATSTVTYVESTNQTSATPVTYESVSSSTTEETICVTTTISTTQTNTVELVTTSEQTYTETLEILTTIGIAKSSNDEILINALSTTTTTIYTDNVDLSYTINITISSFSGGSSNSFTTPVQCETIEDLLLLFKSSNPGYDYAAIEGWSEDSVIFLLCQEVVDEHIGFMPQEVFICGTYSDGTELDEDSYIYVEKEAFKIETITTTTTTSTQTLTSVSKLSDLGITSMQYITIQNNGVETIIECSTSDLMENIIDQLLDAGITASISNGIFSILESESSYISGMSEYLKTKLKLTGDFTSVVTTTSVTTTTTLETITSSEIQTLTLKTTTTLSETRTTTTFSTSTLTATGATSFEEMGANDFNLSIIFNGARSSLRINKEETISEFLSKLIDKGFQAEINSGVLSFVGIGDSYISSTILTDLFNLGALNKTEAQKTVNTVSNELICETNILGRLGGDVYAPGILAMQVGTSGDKNSKINIQTSMKLGCYEEFRKIGKDNKDRLTKIDELLETLSIHQTALGSAQNRLLSALEEISVQKENLISSRSTLRDADISEVSSEYIRQQILQQASATLMATANQSPSIAIQLI